jgi:putative spermidine/putrescine transport system permease protein
MSLAALAGVVLLFLCLPIAIVVPMSFSSADSLQFPPPGFGLRWYDSFFHDTQWLGALKTSLYVAVISSMLALVLGSVAAYGLVRGVFRGRRAIDLNFAVPMVIPHIITAIALYIAFARLGWLGSLTGLILAHVILAAPYVVLVISVALGGFDPRIEQVASTLGASAWTVLLRVVAPNMKASLFAAWICA